MNNIKFLFKNITKKSTIIIAITITAIVSISYIFYGLFIGLSTENAINKNPQLALFFIFLYAINLLIFNTFLDNKSIQLYKKIELNLQNNINKKLYKKILALPVKAFEELQNGELLNRITNDCTNISNTFETIINLLFNIIISFILMFYIFYNSPLVGLEILLFLGTFFIISKFSSSKIKNLNKEITKINDDYTSLLNESFRGIREIKTLGIKNTLVNNIANLINLLCTNKSKLIDLETKYLIIGSGIKSLLECGIYATCIILLTNNNISVSFFIAITWYIYRYTVIIDNFSIINTNYQSLSISITRINEILNNTLYADVKFGKTTIKDLKGEIKFNNVSFSYNNANNTLENFNLIISPNKKVAIVGASGQGKTTIFNLLTRIFEPTSGEILIDNININSLTEKNLRESISIIRQDPYIFNKSILENFLIVNEKLSLEEIRIYTKMAYIDDYIMELPQQYNTILGEGGVNLSGGQKQRLAIARALIKKSKIILFDEATSALDNDSQLYIKKSINNLSKSNTVIMIAHRLSTIIDADIIHVINNGKIIASGTHNELIKSCEYYNSLYNKEATIMV